MSYTDPRLFKRYSENPILTPENIPYECRLVFNPAACKTDKGKYVLIPRTVGYDWTEALLVAFSDDGYKFEIESEPVLVPADDEGGKINDPRITYIEGWYYLTYCSDPSWPENPPVRDEGIYLCIARSRDLRNWERIYKSEPDNRNAVIFPERIDDLFARLDRPFARGYRTEGYGYDIWISFSPDMKFWGRHKLVLSHLDIPWGSNRIGPGAPPIKTDEGWLCIFHGEFIPDEQQLANHWVKWKQGQTRVCFAGAMLLDLDDPSTVRAVSEYPVLVPTEPYEFDRRYRPSVVFPTGAILEDNNELRLYYGASDTSVALAVANINDVIDFILSEGKKRSETVTFGGQKNASYKNKKKIIRAR